MTDHSHHSSHGHTAAPAGAGAPADPHVLEHEIASIFPLITSFATALFLFGTAATWNAYAFGPALIVLGMTIQVAALIGWWSELVRDNKLDETTLIGTPAEARQGLRIGFGFFIGSEVMFFAAFFAYYFYARGLSPVWPPPGFEKLPWEPALINTFLLVFSGFFYMRGEHLLEHGKSKARTLFWMVAALVFGFVFLGIQIKEWYELINHHGFTVKSGPMGTAFYLLTGFHGLHVIIGAIFITVVTSRIALNHFTPHKHFAMTAAGWYWHFVDVVWIGLVLCLYLYDYFRDWMFPVARQAIGLLEPMIAGVLALVA